MSTHHVTACSYGRRAVHSQAGFSQQPPGRPRVGNSSACSRVCWHVCRGCPRGGMLQHPCEAAGMVPRSYPLSLLVQHGWHVAEGCPLTRSVPLDSQCGKGMSQQLQTLVTQTQLMATALLLPRQTKLLRTNTQLKEQSEPDLGLDMNLLLPLLPPL